MSTSHAKHAVTRRTALGSLGAGGPGLALAARGAATQDASTAMATHPIVGLWQNAVNGPDAAKMPWTFSVFHADGTYHEWNGMDAGAALGIWRPTGANTAELLFTYQDTDPTTETEAPGTATRVTFDSNPSTGSTVSATEATPATVACSGGPGSAPP